jgi:hypothetical protein
LFIGPKANLYNKASNIKKLTAVHPITYKFPKAGGLPAGCSTGKAPPDAIQKVANPITITMVKRRINEVLFPFILTDVLPPISPGKCI